MVDVVVIEEHELLESIYQVAYDMTLQPDDAMRRIRDLFLEASGAETT